VVFAEPVRAMASMSEAEDWIALGFCIADGEIGDCGEGREM
jgi:hypothetical protein